MDSRKNATGQKEPTEQQTKDEYNNLSAEQKKKQTYTEWLKENYNYQYERWMPWIEDQYLKWFGKGDNKVSYATKRTIPFPFPALSSSTSTPTQENLLTLAIQNNLTRQKSRAFPKSTKSKTMSTILSETSWARKVFWLRLATWCRRKELTELKEGAKMTRERMEAQLRGTVTLFWRRARLLDRV
jgi:hypothetical protein